MARKKGKKKNPRKKDMKKKDIRKKDIKKELKKKKSEKKEPKKKDVRKKKTKKKDTRKKDKPKEQAISYTDHSSNYNVRNAVNKLRSLTSPEQVQIFTKGEERLTVTRSIPAVMKRFG